MRKHRQIGLHVFNKIIDVNRDRRSSSSVTGKKRDRCEKQVHNIVNARYMYQRSIFSRLYSLPLFFPYFLDVLPFFTSERSIFRFSHVSRSRILQKVRAQSQAIKNTQLVEPQQTTIIVVTRWPIVYGRMYVTYTVEVYQFFLPLCETIESMAIRLF